MGDQNLVSAPCFKEPVELVCIADSDTSESDTHLELF